MWRVKLRVQKDAQKQLVRTSLIRLDCSSNCFMRHETELNARANEQKVLKVHLKLNFLLSIIFLGFLFEYHIWKSIMRMCEIYWGRIRMQNLRCVALAVYRIQEYCSFFNSISFSFFMFFLHVYSQKIDLFFLC